MPLRLSILPGRLAVCRLSASESLPCWALPGGGVLWSVTRTPDELSVVIAESAVPPEVRAEREWRALKVAGLLDFGLVGVLASLTAPLASAGVSVFVLSTFDTDYLLVRDPDLPRAVAVLRDAGFTIEEELEEDT